MSAQPVVMSSSSPSSSSPSASPLLPSAIVSSPLQRSKRRSGRIVGALNYNEDESAELARLVKVYAASNSAAWAMVAAQLNKKFAHHRTVKSVRQRFYAQYRRAQQNDDQSTVDALSLLAGQSLQKTNVARVLSAPEDVRSRYNKSDNDDDSDTDSDAVSNRFTSRSHHDIVTVKHETTAPQTDATPVASMATDFAASKTKKRVRPIEHDSLQNRSANKSNSVPLMMLMMMKMKRDRERERRRHERERAADRARQQQLLLMMMYTCWTRTRT